MALGSWLLPAGRATAAPPAPGGLEVQGGEDAWHPDRMFRLRWVNPAGVTAVRYLVRDPLGGVAVAEQRLGWPASEVVGLQVPAVPGAYTAEVRLEDAGGQVGAAAQVKLRFDDGRPTTVEPLPASTWIGRAGFPFTLRLAHGAGSPPVSGIRGYAISIDSRAGSAPCAAADTCTDAETDLHGGAGDDSLTVGELPEGVSYVQAVSVSGSGMRSAAVGRAVLRVDKTDPTTRLSGLPADWVNRPVTLSAAATDTISGMEPGTSGAAPFTAIRVDGGAPALAAGDSVSARVIAEGTHRLAYYARDLAGNVDDGRSSNGVPNPAPRTAFVRIDFTPPDIAFRDAQDPGEPELIRALVGDSASGIDPASGWIGARRAGSGEPFRPLPVTPAPGELRARWDSEAFPSGAYEFAAGIGDIAGNRADTKRRRDGRPMVLSNPLKTPTELRAAFRRGELSRLAPYGRGVLLGGRLTDRQGDPLVQAPLRIVERFAGGGATRESLIHTGADGGFSARLEPGPSRDVQVLFGGSATLTHSASGPLRLAVRGGVRLHASARQAKVGGPPLVFAGRVAAAPGTIPRAGKSVELQFRLAGRPWQEFRTVETDRRGRFRYAYRFSDDDSRGVTFQFRAYAPAQDDWPYEPGGSRPIVIRGR
ncbi:MAG TPA: hypothetical protein VHQ43_10985 [Solirubrobacterales bacterium]|nr:hypothetical protein [Solirubrobacterales bacterium]